MAEHEATIDGRAPASSWYALAILIGTTIFAYVDRQIINLIAPLLQKQFTFSDLQLGALQGLALALFAAAAAYPVGWLADRYGRRLILGTCVLIWAASTAACAFQNSFTGLFAAAAGIAIGEAALGPIIFAMIPDLFPGRQRNMANLIFFAATTLGGAAGYALGGVTLDLLSTHHQSLPPALAAMDGWRVAMLIVALPAPLFVLLLMTIRMGVSVGHVTAADDSRADRALFLPFIRPHWRAFACIYGAIAAFAVPVMVTCIWIPVAMSRAFGLAPSTIGLELGAVSAVSVIAGLALPGIASRLAGGTPELKPLRLVQFFLMAAIPPALLLPFATAPWQAYAASGMQTVCGLAALALLPGITQQLSPPALRSRLLALATIVTAFPQAVAPMLAGAVSGALDGPRGLLMAITLVGVPGWVIGALLARLARRPFIATASTVASADERLQASTGIRA
jgi:MFS family permease